MIQVNGNHTVTIKDSTGNGVIRSTGHVASVTGGGTLNIKSGNFISTGNTAMWAGGAQETGHIIIDGGNIIAQEFAIAVGKDSTLIVNDGKFVAQDNAVLGGNGSAGKFTNATIIVNGGEFEGHIQTSGYTGCGIYMPNSGTVTINDGKFTIDGVGICARAGEINIAGGEFISTVDTAGWVGDKKSQITPNGIFYDGAAKYPGLDDTAKVNITGGTFTNTADNSIPGVKVTQPDNGIEVQVNSGSWTK